LDGWRVHRGCRRRARGGWLKGDALHLNGEVRARAVCKVTRHRRVGSTALRWRARVLPKTRAGHLGHGLCRVATPHRAHRDASTSCCGSITKRRQGHRLHHSRRAGARDGRLTRLSAHALRGSGTSKARLNDRERWVEVLSHQVVLNLHTLGCVDGRRHEDHGRNVDVANIAASVGEPHAQMRHGSRDARVRRGGDGLRSAQHAVDKHRKRASTVVNPRNDTPPACSCVRARACVWQR